MARASIVKVELPKLRMAFVGGPMAGVHHDADEPQERIDAILDRRLREWPGPGGEYVTEPISGPLRGIVTVYANWQPNEEAT